MLRSILLSYIYCRKTGIMIDESKVVKDVLGYDTIDSFFAACYMPGGTSLPPFALT